MSSRSDSSRHPFFRVMVLMGGSIAVGCGGKTTTSEGNSTHTDEGSQGGGPNGQAGSIINLPIASNATSGSGGGPSEIIVITGTAGAPPQPVIPGPFACAPAQWDCSKDSPTCTYDESGWVLPEKCACDTSRPQSADDCAPGQVFVCRKGMETADRRPLATTVPFECSCAPKGPSCNDECAQVYINSYDLSCLDPTDPSARAILCGCAIPYLN